ncbi:PAS domain-containing protein [Rhizobium calliandrae]|uniref:histidine kinase n=1 Tax=Rhizobium calliandrae TaxID=1312182 RepID=A0ABT7KPC1_9HYPH|nr:PAS domain-containing protein [Rhizobium calliandrae]MDL2410461.1 PAS domain-containing protein [Rhizobium calliandrae]
MDGKQSLILNSVAAMVWTMRSDGGTQFLNRRCAEYAGIRDDDCIGWLAAIDPAAVSALVERMHSCHSGERFAAMEARIRRSDGQYRTFFINCSQVAEGLDREAEWCATAIEVDDVVHSPAPFLRSNDDFQADKAGRASEENFRKIINALPTLAWSTRPDGYCDFLSDRWLEYTGFTHEQAEGWAWAAALHPDDAKGLEIHWRTALASGVAVDAEARLRRFDGEYRWFLFRANPLRDDMGNVIKWYGINIDIEDRKRADEALRESERGLRKIINTIPTTAWTTRADGYCDFLSDRWLDYAGLTLEQAEGWGWAAVIHPDDAEEALEYWRAALAAGTPVDTEMRMRRFDGEYRWFLIRGNPLRDDQGSIIKWCGTTIDIEDRKRADEALRTSEFNLRKIINAIPTAAWSTRPDGYCEFVNDRWLDYTGFTPEQAEGWAWAAALHPDDAKRLETHWRGALASGVAVDVEARMRRFDGEYRWFLFRANPLRDQAGNVIKWYGINIDIEDRKRASEALQESERQSRLVVDSIPGLVAVFGPDGEIQGLNQQFLAYLGQTLEEFANWPTNGTVHPDDLTRHVETLDHSLASGQVIDFETRLRRFDGVYRWFQIRGTPTRDGDGKIASWYCLMTDVEDLKRIEAQLRNSKSFLADAQRLSQTGSFAWKLATDEMTWSDETYRLYEFDPDTPISFDLIRTRVHPDNLPALKQVMEQAKRDQVDFDYETRLLMPDRSIKYLRVVAHKQMDKDGQWELRGAVQDVTASRVAEQALSKARADLSHVARVSSLGALTASIAHEVNQPLSGIITNASTCLLMLDGDPPNIEIAKEAAGRAIRDGNRAAEVITRLRALFGKKTVAIETVDLREALNEIIAISWGDLQRAKVILRTDFANGQILVAGDRIQLQQVIMNLLRNAIEALNEVEDRPRHLLIRTELCDDGRVQLSLKDSGVGVGPADLDRIFEAFYTTKNDGMGIGLSVCRTIIENHKGRLWASVDGTPGVTVSFSLPSIPGAANALRSTERQDKNTVRIS